MPEVADGKYRATAETADLGFSSTGKEFVSVLFRFLDYPAIRLTWRGFFTEKTQERTFESLRACGWAGTDISQVAFPEGNEVVVDVKNETYEGKTHPQIAWVNALRGPSVKNAMDPASAKVFAERIKGALVAFDQGNPPAKAAVPF